MATSITVAEVVSYLGLDSLAGDDLSVMTDVVAAVNAEIVTNVPRIRAAAAGTDWPPDVILAAKMMAARLFTRRRSPTGIATYTETGGPVFTPRWDPDIEKLCLIGKWAPPGFA